MNRHERYENFEEALRSALLGWQADLWSALPGIVQSVDLSKKTCVVQVTIKMRVTSPKDGSQSWVAISPLLDCPLFFPSGGGCTLTFPVKKDDECLVVFSSRCIDAWWQNGGVQNQPILRMHDLSDGFAFVGISSLPNVQNNINTNAVELRSNDGQASVRLHPTTHEITVTSPSNVKVNSETAEVISTTASVKATTINLEGTTVNIKGKLVINSQPYIEHTHFGVKSGGQSSGGVAQTIAGADAIF